MQREGVSVERTVELLYFGTDDSLVSVVASAPRQFDPKVITYDETVCWHVSGIGVDGNMPWLQTGSGVGGDEQAAECHDPRQFQARNAISHNFGSLERRSGVYR